MPEKIKKQKIILDLRKSDERQVFCILEILQNVVQTINKNKKTNAKIHVKKRKKKLNETF